MIDMLESVSAMTAHIGAAADLGHASKKRIGRYEIVRLLQEGATSSVWLGVDIYSGEVVGVKKMTLNNADDCFDVASHECWAHQQVDSHPNIVKLRGMSIMSPYEIGIATEYCPNGDLFEYHRARDGRLTAAEFFHFALQISSALTHMHSLGFAHCDVKPENCLLADKRTLKLADFGSARHISERSCVRTHGTNGFQSPEEILGRRVRDLRASDVWACGVTFFNLITGHLPFAVAHLSCPDFACHVRGRKSRAKAAVWAQIPRGMAELIEGMLKVERRERLTMQEVHIRLQILEARYVMVLAAPISAAAAATADGDVGSSSAPGTEPPTATTSCRSEQRALDPSASDGRHHAGPSAVAAL